MIGLPPAAELSRQELKKQSEGGRSPTKEQEGAVLLRRWRQKAQQQDRGA